MGKGSSSKDNTSKDFLDKDNMGKDFLGKGNRLIQVILGLF